MNPDYAFVGYCIIWDEWGEIQKVMEAKPHSGRRVESGGGFSLDGNRKGGDTSAPCWNDCQQNFLRFRNGLDFRSTGLAFPASR